MKTCTKCGETKPATVEFFHRHRDGLTGQCKRCKNRAKYDERRKDPNYHRKRAERKSWGRAGVYEELVYQQGERCAVCGTSDNGGVRLCVDHSHDTGVVRGLLCRACNLAIGWLKDDPELLLAAHDYVLYPPCAHLGYASRVT